MPHSPTPWSSTEDEQLLEYDVWDADGNRLFSVSFSNEDEDEEQADADVRLILEAVNGRGDLATALRNLLWQWDNHKTLMGLALADARAALAEFDNGSAK